MLLYLPTEIIIKILSFVGDYRTVVRCSQVCRALKSTVKDSTLLFYLVELDAAGMVDNPESTLSVFERFESFTLYQHAWDAMAPSREKVAIYDLPAGAFEFCQGHLCCAHTEEPDSMTVVKLPSALSNTGLDIWKLPPVQFKVHDLCIDPVQDLMILLAIDESDLEEVTATIHILTLSNGQPHPLCSSHVVSSLIGPYTLPIYSTTFMQIIDSKFLLFHRYAEIGYFSLVNWKSGEILLNIANGDYMSATFINKDEFLMFNHSNTTISLSIHDINNTPEDISESIPDRVYNLPELISGTRITQVACYVDIREALEPLHQPFWFKNEDKILVIMFTMLLQTIETCQCSLYMQLSTLAPENHLPRQPQPPTPIPWKQWSPGKTAWMERDTGDWYERPVVSGDRYLSSWEDTVVSLELIDFNRSRFKRGTRQEQHVVRLPFAEGQSNDISESTLPYRRIKSLTLSGTIGTMIGVEHLVSLERNHTDMEGSIALFYYPFPSYYRSEDV